MEEMLMEILKFNGGDAISTALIVLLIFNYRKLDKSITNMALKMEEFGKKVCYIEGKLNGKGE